GWGWKARCVRQFPFSRANFVVAGLSGYYNQGKSGRGDGMAGRVPATQSSPCWTPNSCEQLMAEIKTPDSRSPSALAISLLILAGLCAYVNSFTKDFVFDDIGWIVGNPMLRPNANLVATVLTAPRPVIVLSVVVNYQ